jgi:ribonuclease Z
MDHFIGFDYLLRVCLGRDCHISIFGPPGFHQQVENKINAYTWNLVENYMNDFAIHVMEVHPDYKLLRSYHCQKAFKPEIDVVNESFNGTLVEDGFF